jgi:hypothetical protein
MSKKQDQFQWAKFKSFFWKKRAIEAWMKEKKEYKEKSKESYSPNPKSLEYDIFHGGIDNQGTWTFNKAKRATWLASDKILKIFNTNVSTQNYQQDPLYKHMENWKNESEIYDWKINYSATYLRKSINSEFSDWIEENIQNRTLKQEDYELLYDRGTDQIRQETFEKLFRVQNKYTSIHVDVFFSYSSKSGRRINWRRFVSGNRMIISKDKSLKQSLEFLENNFDICFKMAQEWVDRTDIWLYLSNNNYQKVIDIKKKLWDYWKLYYYNNSKGDGYKLCARDSSTSVATWKTLEEMIDDLCSKQWLFDQKEKIDNINWGDRAKYCDSPAERMWYVLNEWRTYNYLNTFWRWKNNAELWFDKPSSWYWLELADTFEQVEYEISAKILMKLMADNWNERKINQNLVPNSTKQNLLRCWAIKIEDDFVIFEDVAIKKIKSKYQEEKEISIENLDELKNFFDANWIVLPS